MPTITIPLQNAIEAFGSLLPHTAPAKEFPDIIKNVGACLDGEDLVLVTTDRYTVGSYRLTAEQRGDAPPLDLPELQIIPGDLAKWIAGLKPRELTMGRAVGYYVQITFNEYVTRIDVLWGDMSDPDNLPSSETARTAPAVRGNFPDVLRLIEGFKPGETGAVSLGGRHLAKFVTSMKVLIPKGDQVAKFEHPEPSKPGPLRVTIGAHFTGLIQPNLLPRRKDHAS